MSCRLVGCYPIPRSLQTSVASSLRTNWNVRAVGTTFAARPLDALLDNPDGNCPSASALGGGSKQPQIFSRSEPSLSKKPHFRRQLMFRFGSLSRSLLLAIAACAFAAAETRASL